ncbi:MAG: hypothetical protein PHX18_00120 [Candidatus Gastranaerophilales bacterium]|nr:hypothetical protein [Candidatus Gastranaerophilales bacterium]
MKKIILLLVCFQLFIMPATAAAPIKDDFVESSLSTYSKQKPTPKATPVEDDFAQKSLNQYGEQKPTHKDTPVEDDFAKKSLNKENIQKPDYTNKLINSPLDFFKKEKKQEVIISDEQIKKYLEEKKYEIPQVNLVYDYTSIEQYPIKIKVAKYVTSKQKNAEGQFINFYTKEKITLKDGTILPANTLITGRIETIAPNQVMGIPADIDIGSFKIDNYPNINIQGTLDKKGANRAIWVYPLAYSGIIFFGIGVVVTYFLFMPIRGGHAKLQKWQTYTIYYK